MAVETLGIFTQDEIDYIRETSLIFGELDWNTGIHDAEQRGRKENNLENARKMKADNMPVSQISKYTGLSAETVAQL